MYYHIIIIMVIIIKITTTIYWLLTINSISTIIINSGNIKTYQLSTVVILTTVFLVGGWATPLKNMKSNGMMKFPFFLGK